MARDPEGDAKRNRSLDALGRRLAEVQRSREAAVTPRQGRLASSNGAAVGFRIAVEILAALVIGFGIGLAADRWFNIAPVGLIVGLLLGGAAAMVNVVRTGRELDQRAKAARAARDRSDDTA